VVQPASTGTDSLDASATLTTGHTPAATGSSTTRTETPAVQHALVAALDDTDDGEDF
jgi:hypothetical protein